MPTILCTVLVLSSAMLFGAAPSLAQANRTEGMVSAAPTAPTAAATPTAPAAAQVPRVSRILGATVRDARNRKIGQIKDLVLDDRRGDVAYAVINFGGVMGVGRKYHAVPWQALQLSEKGRYFVLPVDKASVWNAPGFDKGNWPDMTDRRWAAEIDRYWSVQIGHGLPNAGALPSAGAERSAPARSDDQEHRPK